MPDSVAMLTIRLNVTPAALAAMSGDASFYRALVHQVSNEEISIRPTHATPKRSIRLNIGKAAFKVGHAHHWGPIVQPMLLGLAAAPAPEGDADACLTPIFNGHPRTTSPIVLCTQGVPSPDEPFLRGWKVDDMRSIHHRVAKRAAAWISWTHHGAGNLVRICPELSGRVRVIHPPATGPIAKRTPTKDDRVGFLLVGQGSPEAKGVPEALEAWRQLAADDEATFTLVSNFRGPVPSSVTSLTPQRKERIRQLMAQADVIVLPSRHEPYGLVVPEGYLHGCAAIVSTTGCLPEVGGDGALLTAPGDARSIAAAMRAYIEDPGLLAAKRSAGLALASSRNTVESWRSEFVRILDTI